MWLRSAFVAFTTCSVALLCGTVAGSVTAASSALTIPGKITPAKGVGSLRLGATEASARRAFRQVGRPTVSAPVRRGTSREYVELQYPHRDVAYGAVSYFVGLQGRPGRRRVVLIDVRTPRNATPQGVAVGKTDAQLLRAYRNLDCRPGYTMSRTTRDGTFCTLGKRKRRNTVFVLSGTSNFEPTARITRIVVREPFVSAL